MIIMTNIHILILNKEYSYRKTTIPQNDIFITVEPQKRQLKMRTFMTFSVRFFVFIRKLEPLNRSVLGIRTELPNFIYLRIYQ